MTPPPAGLESSHQNLLSCAPPHPLHTHSSISLCPPKTWLDEWTASSTFLLVTPGSPPRVDEGKASSSPLFICRRRRVLCQSAAEIPRPRPLSLVTVPLPNVTLLADRQKKGCIFQSRLLGAEGFSGSSYCSCAKSRPPSLPLHIGSSTGQLGGRKRHSIDPRE